MPRAQDVDKAITDLGIREQELLLKKNKAMLQRGVARYPELAAKLVFHAESLGYDLSSKTEPGDPVPGASPAKSNQALAQEVRLKKLRENSHAAAAAVKGDEAKWLHEKYKKLSDFSAVMLREEVLANLDEVALSRANLRSMRAAGGAAGSKNTRLAIVEFITGLPPNFELMGPLRHKAHLVAYLM